MKKPKSTRKPIPVIRSLLRNVCLVHGMGGRSDEGQNRLCVMQLVNLMNGEHRNKEGHLDDHPPCVVNWLADMSIFINDAFLRAPGSSDDILRRRNKLKQFAPRMLDTAYLNQRQERAMNLAIVNWFLALARNLAPKNKVTKPVLAKMPTSITGWTVKLRASMESLTTCFLRTSARRPQDEVWGTMQSMFRCQTLACAARTIVHHGGLCGELIENGRHNDVFRLYDQMLPPAPKGL